MTCLDDRQFHVLNVLKDLCPFSTRVGLAWAFFLASAWTKTVWLCFYCHLRNAAVGMEGLSLAKVPVNISHTAPFSDITDVSAGASIYQWLPLQARR